MANRLAQETSPYLLQHRDNPVDWYPWGKEALARALDEDRPILLSVGYSACHWCHVMERESFEDPETAAYMNDHFVNVKVDREERPDVDALYMEAVQSMTGQGGWPMTVFLDPEGVPFYGGTYFPPDEGRGMPSFRMVMEAIVASFEGKREEIRERAESIRRHLGAIGEIEPDPELPSTAELAAAVRQLLASADRRHGGFRGAPKFPPASSLELLLTRGERGGEALAVVEETLDAMLAGGIYDQLGGGFARYSVDAVWLVPHFEKMLYDNALLARAYLHGWQVLGHERYRRVCEETLDWMLREMRGPEGGFYSALDADSEGEEGRFYVWFPEQIREVLGVASADGASEGEPIASADEVIEFYGVSERGNFEGANILHLAQGVSAEPPAGLDAARRALYEARAKRVWPGLDDKRLTAWNALAISALAEAGAVLGREDYLDAARECAQFVLGSLRDDEGRLLRTYKDGDARLNAYLEDHAFLLEALLTLYESSFEQRWFAAARDLGDEIVARFGDVERGGFFSTSSDHEQLIARRKELGDHPIPAGNSSAALGLLRLEALTGEREYGNQAERVLRLFARTAVQHPESFAHLLRALDFALEPTREVALVGAAEAEGPAGENLAGRAAGGSVAALAAAVRAEFRPRLVLAAGPEGSDEPPLLSGRATVDGHQAAYVCQNFICRLPVTDPAELEASIAESNGL
jgi:uncharacterized protein YyaL (SSP411 family)